MKKTRQPQMQRSRADLTVRNDGNHQNSRSARHISRRNQKKPAGWLAVGLALVLIFTAGWLIRPLLQSRQTDATSESAQTTGATTTAAPSGTTTAAQTTTTEARWRNQSGRFAGI